MLKVLSHDRNVVPNLSRKCDRRSQRGDFDTSASIVPKQYSLFHFSSAEKNRNFNIDISPFLTEHPQILCNFTRKSSTPFEGKSFRWQGVSRVMLSAVNHGDGDVIIVRTQDPKVSGGDLDDWYLGPEVSEGMLGMLVIPWPDSSTKPGQLDTSG